jgi:hypothetical protein
VSRGVCGCGYAGGEVGEGSGAGFVEGKSAEDCLEG